MLKSDTKTYFLCGASKLFGGWLLYVGAMKWIAGASGFVGYITKSFSETWVPYPLLLGMGWMILCAEVLCGLWLLSGKCSRMAWTATALLLFALTFGQTLLQKHDVVANNWQYVIFALACAAISDPVVCNKKEAG